MRRESRDDGDGSMVYINSLDSSGYLFPSLYRRLAICSPIVSQLDRLHTESGREFTQESKAQGKTTVRVLVMLLDAAPIPFHPPSQNSPIHHPSLSKIPIIVPIYNVSNDHWERHRASRNLLQSR